MSQRNSGVNSMLDFRLHIRIAYKERLRNCSAPQPHLLIFTILSRLFRNHVNRLRLLGEFYNRTSEDDCTLVAVELWQYRIFSTSLQ